MQIAIDGPAGAGKSTIAKILAEEINAIYIDTGAMYRALAYKAIVNLVDPDDSEMLKIMAKNTYIDFGVSNSGQLVFCDSVDVTKIIRTPEVTRVVPRVAVHPEVREIMVSNQQKLAFSHDVIMDGRDIGETVLPNADFKFFVTASAEERARRRVAEWEIKGEKVDFSEVLKEIRDRDEQDAVREVGALRILPDSIVIDTTDLSIEETVAKMRTIIGSR